MHPIKWGQPWKGVSNFSSDSLAFSKAGLILQQQPFPLPESVQSLTGIAFRAARKSGKTNSSSVAKLWENPSSKEFRTVTAFSQKTQQDPPPHMRFSKMIFRNASNLESVLLAEPHVAVMNPDPFSDTFGGILPNPPKCRA